MSKCDCKDCPCKKPKTIEERLEAVEKALEERVVYVPYPVYQPYQPYRWTYNPWWNTNTYTSTGTGFANG